MPSIDAPPTPKISTTSQSPPQVEFLPDPRQSRVEEESGVDNGDIYRGEPPTPSRTPRPESLSSIAPSTSSSSSFAFGGRLGAISALVEHAITHWARAWASTSSLGSSSSSSSTSTNSITTKSRTRKRRRRRSLADLHNAKSEREVAARIRAREEARQIPREFVLHTPPSLSAGSRPSHRDGTQSGEPQANLDDILHTTELPLIISKLNMALKDNFKVRRAQGPVRVSAPRSKSVNTQQALDMSSPLLHHDYMLPEDLARRIASPEALVDPSGRKSRKSKQRANKPERSMSAPPRVPTEKEMDRAWWLDVSSPTWEDMRTIAKLLHLHPLTLEDILQQDPREKLELFPKLGYYFISFRAIESRRTRERYNLGTAGMERDRIVDQGIVSEVNVYLIVFREGIVSFHFADISDHTDAVRNRVLMRNETATMSSDWIAHGIMDSIVDSFFPFLDEIDKEVTDIESLVYASGPGSSLSSGDPLSPTASNSSSSTTATPQEKSSDDEKPNADLVIKKEDTIQSAAAKTHFSLPHRRRFSFRRVTQAVEVVKSLLRRGVNARKLGPTMTTRNVRRMARARRLVTSLTRFLHTKSEVVTQIKKRLLKTGEFGLGNGTGDDQDVFVYMGDVQDHILALQQSLAHYERLLSQSHPTYLTQLRFSVSSARSGSDKAVVQLTTISLGVLLVQTLIGLFSMNVMIPTNPHFPYGKYNVFGAVLAGAVSIVCVYAIVVWWWWEQARRRRGRLVKA